MADYVTLDQHGVAGILYDEGLLRSVILRKDSVKYNMGLAECFRYLAHAWEEK